MHSVLFLQKLEFAFTTALVRTIQSVFRNEHVRELASSFLQRSIFIVSTDGDRDFREALSQEVFVECAESLPIGPGRREVQREIIHILYHQFNLPQLIFILSSIHYVVDRTVFRRQNHGIGVRWSHSLHLHNDFMHLQMSNRSHRSNHYALGSDLSGSVFVDNLSSGLQQVHSMGNLFTG